MAITVNLRYLGKNGAARAFAEEMISSGTNVLHTDIQSGIIRPKKGGVDYGS